MALLRECRRCKDRWNPKDTSFPRMKPPYDEEDRECCNIVLNIPRDPRKGAYYRFGETDPAAVEIEDDLCQVCARLLVKWLDGENG